MTYLILHTNINRRYGGMFDEEKTLPNARPSTWPCESRGSGPESSKATFRKLRSNAPAWVAGLYAPTQPSKLRRGINMSVPEKVWPCVLEPPREPLLDSVAPSQEPIRQVGQEGSIER